MSSKIGYFVMNQMSGQRGWTADETSNFFEHMKRLRPTVMLFLDDYGKALQTKELLPDCAVVVRSYRSDIPEGELWQKRTPQQVFDDYKTTDPRIIRNILNEPNSYISDDDLRKFAKWCSDVMDLFGNAGLSIALPNFGEGHPDVDRLDRLEALWIAFDKWHDVHYLNIHEYGTWRGMLFNEGGKFDVTPWRIGRFEAFTVPYLNKTAHKIPRVIVGEFGCDSAHDNTNNRGWRSAWNEGRYIDEIKAAIDRFYHQPHYIGLTLFCYGNTGQPFTESDWSTFDVSKSDIPSLLETMTPAPAQPPFDYGTMRHVQLNITSASINTINLRAMPSIDSTILAQLIDGDDLQYSQNGFNSGGYTWFKVISAGITGFVAQTPNFEVIPVFSEPPPVADKTTVIIRIKGLTVEAARELVNNVEISIE